MRAERVIRDAFHRARTFAPRRPFERPAPEFPGLAAWPPRLPVLDAFSPPSVLAGLSRARSPSTRPAASGRHASLNLGVACRLLQPENDARAHPTSVRSSHASGAFAPLLAGTNRCRLRWSTMRHRTGDLRTSTRHAPGLRAMRSTGRGQSRPRAEAFEQRRAARSWTMSRVPSS